jgi:hypothetical protein
MIQVVLRTRRVMMMQVVLRTECRTVRAAVALTVPAVCRLMPRAIGQAEALRMVGLLRRPLRMRWGVMR